MSRASDAYTDYINAELEHEYAERTGTTPPAAPSK